MKRPFLYLVLWIFLAPVLPAETDFDIDTKIFLPPVYYIGDEVELRLKIKLLDDQVNIAVPEQLPVEQWIEIKRITYINFPKDIVTFNIFFVTFKPGKHLLPALQLGDILLEGIEINTQSVLEKMDVKKISPRRGQIELPGTSLKIILGILLILLVPAASLVTYKYIKLLIKKILLAREKEVPKNRIRKSLQQLLKKVEQLDSREFYIKLADITREYLEKRFLIPALTLTTRELVKFFKNCIQEKELQEKIYHFSGILQYSDLVKFGGTGSSCEEKIGKAHEVLKIVDLIEEEQTDVKS